MTTQQCLDWVNGGWKSSKYAKTNSHGTGLDVDGSYGFQCYDWVAGYSDWLGEGITYVEGAADFWTSAPASFKRVQDPQPGDIHVYGKPYGWNGARFLGHTGIVTGGSSRNSFTSVDQNWNNANLDHGSPPSTVQHNANGLLGFLRSSKISNMELGEASVKVIYDLAFEVEDYKVPQDIIDAYAHKPIREGLDGLLTQLHNDPTWLAHKAAQGQTPGFEKLGSLTIGTATTDIYKKQ